MPAVKRARVERLLGRPSTVRITIAHVQHEISVDALMELARDAVLVLDSVAREAGGLTGKGRIP